jgi:hypothetical protein
MAIERSIEPPLILLELAEQKSLPLVKDGPGERCCEECGATPEEGHEDGCSFAGVDDENE